MKAFFVVYHSAFEEIARSQVLPYVYGLADAGIGFHLISFEKSPLDRKAADPVEGELSRRGVRWVRLRYRKRPRLLAKCVDHLVGTVVVSWLLLRQRPDIVHMRGVMACLSAFLPAKLFGARVLFDVRGELADEYVGGGLLRDGSLVYRVLKGFQRLCYRFADHLIVLTEKHQLHLEELGFGEKVTVIPCCVDADRFSPRAGAVPPERIKSRFTLVYHGKVETWYRFPEMLDFLERYRRVIPDVHLLVLTQTPEARYRGLIAEKGLEKNVTTLHPAFEEIPSLLSCCQAGLMFINPYRKFSSWPVKLPECLACGLPVVINAGIGDTEEFLARHQVGSVVRSFDAAAYDRAIADLQELLQAPGLDRRCRDTALSELSLSLALERYGRIYELLAD